MTVQLVKGPSGEPESSPTCVPAIILREVSFAYNKGGPDLFAGLNLKLFNPFITCVSGALGSGKTTLGKLMVGLLRPTRGAIQIFGRDSGGLSLGHIGRQVAYLFQQPRQQVFAATTAEELTLSMVLTGYSQARMANRRQHLLRLFGLEHRAGAHPFRLSRGELQRLALATLFVGERRYMILDEPFTGLDAAGRYTLVRLLRRTRALGIGACLISHDPLAGTLADVQYTLTEAPVA